MKVTRLEIRGEKVLWIPLLTLTITHTRHTARKTDTAWSAQLFVIGGQRVPVAQPGSRSEMVNTLDFESKDPSSSLGGTLLPFNTIQG